MKYCKEAFSDFIEVIFAEDKEFDITTGKDANNKRFDQQELKYRNQLIKKAIKFIFKYLT